jgi:hypothetical protein
LSRVKSEPFSQWVDRIESKGYLLLIPRRGLQNLRETAARHAVEQATAKKLVLVRWTKLKRHRELKDQIEKTRLAEPISKAAFELARAMPVGFVAKVVNQQSC